MPDTVHNLLDLLDDIKSETETRLFLSAEALLNTESHPDVQLDNR